MVSPTRTGVCQRRSDFEFPVNSLTDLELHECWYVVDGWRQGTMAALIVFPVQKRCTIELCLVIN